MGLVESTLKVKTVRPLVRPDTVTPLPSLAIDSCRFTDDTVGFLVTTVDLAKNMASYSIPLKDTYSPAENMFVFIGKEETCVTFTKDRLTGRVFCSISRASNMPRVVRACVTTYDPIDNQDIDRIATLFTKQS
jgi:hypothetical protein